MAKEREAMRRLKRLDKLACDANSLWHALEGEKRAMAEQEGISDRAMVQAGIFVPGMDFEASHDDRREEP